MPRNRLNSGTPLIYPCGALDGNLPGWRVTVRKPARRRQDLAPAASFSRRPVSPVRRPRCGGPCRPDPQGFLDGVELPAILDEIQNVPEVFNFVRSRIDRAPRRRGQWFLTGSQETGLMRNVTESMAGRAAVLQLRPLSARESPKVGLSRGGYPEVLARPQAAALWFSSYLQTYLERDVRAISAVQDLAVFRRFLALVASRHGQVLNKSDLAAPLGMSVPSIGRWLGILEATGQILVVPPYFDNLGKRLIKSPRICVADSGLACHLLGIDTDAELEKSPFLGALFEDFIAAEIVKAQLNSGRRRERSWKRSWCTGRPAPELFRRRLHPGSRRCRGANS